MFADASAIVAILTYEEEKPRFEKLLQDAERIFVSPLTIYEAVLAVTRKVDCPLDVARQSVTRFCEDTDAEVVAVTPETGTEALMAFAQYGKGRHPAGLNMGDCFAYACAKLLGVPLLCKGNDFRQTNLPMADELP